MLAEWKEIQRTVIGYIYKHGVDAFNLGLSRLKKVYFEGDTLWLWGVAVTYNSVTLGVPSDLEQFRKFVRSKKVDEEKLFSLEKELRTCLEACTNTDEAGFIWSMGRLAEIVRHLKFEEALDSAHKNLESVGYLESKSFLLRDLSNIETGGIDLGQEGNIINESKEMMKEVNEARRIRDEVAIELGFPSIDRVLFGVYPGELMLSVGWTGSGKTTMCVNTAVHNTMLRNKNVVYITTETTRTPLRRRMFARMTKLPVFDEYVPVSSQAMKSGELNEDEKKTLLYLSNYLVSEPHGVLQVVQAPAQATVDWLRGKLLQYESQFRVDLVIVDDLRSLTPAIRRTKEFEEITQIVRDLKGIARTHANRGVPVISPHHINRDAYKKVTSGDMSMFNLSALSGSSEAEKRSDIVIGIWYDQNEDAHGVRVDLMKVRDGAAGGSIPLKVQWEFQFLYEAERIRDNF